MALYSIYLNMQAKSGGGGAQILEGWLWPPKRPPPLSAAPPSETLLINTFFFFFFCPWMDYKVFEAPLSMLHHVTLPLLEHFPSIFIINLSNFL